MIKSYDNHGVHRTVTKKIFAWAPTWMSSGEFVWFQSYYLEVSTSESDYNIYKTKTERFSKEEMVVKRLTG